MASFDYVIIGAGPAGIQLAYALEKNKRSYLVLEQADKPGAFFAQFPRHNQLISINKVHTGFTDPEVNLRWDWNSLLCDDTQFRFGNYSRQYFPHPKDLLRYLQDFVNKYKLNIKYKHKVVVVDKGAKLFKIVIEDEKEVIQAKRVIVATGVSKPYIPDIPGIEDVDQYFDCDMDEKRFENKRVLIIGKGNSGFETADHVMAQASLIHIASPNPLNYAWRSHYVGHLRAVNNNLLDTYQLKSQNAVVNSHINKIEKKEGKYYVEFAYTLANNEVEVIPYDIVICCTGFQLDTSIFTDKTRPTLRINDRFAALTPCYESVNIKDLYFAGTLMQERDFKKEQSGFIHGFRYNVDFLGRYMEERYHKKALVAEHLTLQSKVIRDKIVREVNQSSALWQQTEYICDVILFKKDKAYYYHGLPRDFVKQPDFHQGQPYLIIYLQFGLERIHHSLDVFAIERVHKDDYMRAHLSTGIHPILQLYWHHDLLSEQHLLEDFESKWDRPEHKKPLLDYLESALARIKQVPAEIEEAH